MSGKTAVLSDVHGNSPALAAVLADIRSLDCTRLFFLGDLVNGVDPQGCVDLLRSWQDAQGAVCLSGNAEWYLLTPDLDTLPHAFVPAEEAEDYKGLIDYLHWMQRSLSPNALAWLAGLPTYSIWEGSCFVHDTPQARLAPQTWYRPDLEEKYQEFYFHSAGIYPTIPPAEVNATFDFLQSYNCSRLFCGHTHVPFLLQSGGKAICNVGSAGATLDGDPRPSWALIDETQQITIRRVSYEIQQTLDMIDHTPGFLALHEPGFIPAYKKWLATGIHWREHLNSDSAA